MFMPCKVPVVPWFKRMSRKQSSIGNVRTFPHCSAVVWQKKTPAISNGMSTLSTCWSTELIYHDVMMILLMEEFLHQLISSLSHYLLYIGFIGFYTSHVVRDFFHQGTCRRLQGVPKDHRTIHQHVVVGWFLCLDPLGLNFQWSMWLVHL